VCGIYLFGGAQQFASFPVMNVTLQRPSPTEANTWLAAGMEAFAADLVASGMDKGAAAERARNDEAELLPQGIDTPGHLIFKVVDGDEHVGWLWLALRSPRGEPDKGWVYDIEVGEAFRGRGYGRAAMQLAEEEARRQGLLRLGLNVFGHNPVASSLYICLGYEVTS
jgi:ribosomal protein S18 acetylase RimI-like enzyme